MSRRHFVRDSLCVLQIAAYGLFSGYVAAMPTGSLESYIFSGQVVNIFDSQNMLGGMGVEVGAAFSGTMSYDLSVPNQAPTDPNYGFYPHSAAQSSLVFNIGSVQILSGPTGVGWEVLNDLDVGGGRVLDGLFANADDPTVSGVSLPSELTDFDNLEFFLQDVSTGMSDVFVDTSLPGALDLSAFNSQQGFIWQTFSADSYDIRVQGVITSLEEGLPPTPIDEPDPYAMMGLGVGLMVWATRKKKRKRA